eukprot:TRINITY_DN4849_c2_g1_i1.p1 TRINITY_DN4849_c2_g1~~TRINITY_DN4849_c2_g1_i1.p1  ORF type:complete len:373 (-),score=65.45 TRINITY_DN4849_c2_g1_i1:29-1147(-)
MVDQKEFEELLSTCMAAASRRQHPSGSDSEGGSSSLSKRKERESSISKQNNNQQKENESGKMEDVDDADYADSKCPKYEKQEEDEEMSFPKGFGLHASERENGNINDNAEKRNFDSFSIPNRVLKPNEESIQGSSSLRLGSIPIQKLSIRSQFDQETESLEEAPIRTTPQIKWVPNKDPRLSSIVEKQEPSSHQQNKNGLNQFQLKSEELIYEHEMPCEEPVTPESMIDEEPFLLSQEMDEDDKDKDQIVLVFPPESPVTSPLDSYNAQYDEYENGDNYQYNNYGFNEEISLKKSFNVVIQIEGVLIDSIDCSTAKNLLGFASENKMGELTQNCLLSEEVLLFQNKLFKLRPGVRENIQQIGCSEIISSVNM